MRKKRTAAPVVRLLDALVVIPAIGLVLIFVPLALTDRADCRYPARQLKDSSQIRGIVQANILWAETGSTRAESESSLDHESTNEAPRSP